MKAYQASLMNGIILIGFGAWGYFASESNSITALIPVLAGLILVLFNGGVRKEKKAISHFVVIFTVVLLGALIKPLTAAIGRSDGMAIFRVAVMMGATILAVFFFVKSFIAARKSK